MKMIKTLAISLLAIQLACTAHRPSRISQPDITSQEILEHVTWLASDALKGRRAGSPEAMEAAAYIKKQFRGDGLSLLGENGYQSFEVLNSLSVGANSRLKIDGATAAPAEFIPLDFSENKALSAGVYFAGYAFSIQSDTLTWQDFSADAAGQWALILPDGPPLPSGKDPFEASRLLRKKAQNAKDSGAGGILFVTGEVQGKEEALIPLRAEQGVTGIGIPVLQINRALAERILKKSGTTLAELQKKLDASLQPVRLPLSCKVEGQAEVIRHLGRTSNVVALLPGGDPTLKQEYVIIGAHYDHLGMGGPGSGSRRPDTLAIHNGADDNASGVAALLELAEKWASERQKPKRSFLFVAFSGEEMGLLGSKYFVNHPLIDLSRVQLMINLDMVGRLHPETRALTCGGSGTATGLGEMVQRLAAPYDLRVGLSPEGYGPSDHASFYGKDIPVLFLWTNISPEYHTPDDDAFRINAPGERAVTQLAFDVSREAADRADRLAFQEAGPKTPPTNMRRFKVTLGIMPDFATTGIKGVRADAVMPDRPAARAGMKKGDIIVAMEGKPVGDIYEYMNRLADFRVGQRISLEVLRDGVQQILIVEL